MENQNYEKLGNVISSSRYLRNPCNIKCIKLVMMLIIMFIVGCALGSIVTMTIYRSKTNSLFGDFNELSQKLQQKINVDFMERQLRVFAGSIHQAGSQRNLELADIVKANWTQWGLQSVTIDKYPINRTVVRATNASVVRLLLDGVAVADLVTVEPSGSDNNKEGLPIYHSYSRGGYARGNVVFVNYGRPKDLTALDAVDVRYCGPTVVVVARLGWSMRSSKVRFLLVVQMKRQMRH